MKASAPIRVASAAGLASTARIANDWVDRTDWMLRAEAAKVLQDHIADALTKREIYLIGDPPEGYLSLNPETNHIGALYTDRPGHGLGKALIHRAKSGRDYLLLWTHAPNIAAQRFYARERSSVVERKDEGNDGLPELRMEWRR